MMSSRTVVDSIEEVSGPPDNLAQLEAVLGGLRRRFPDATIDRYLGAVPALADRVHLASGAVLVGDVRLAEDVSVWHHSVLRADINFIEIGPRTNIQDATVIHLGDRDPAIIGSEVVIGHRAVIHGCRIEDGVLIGIGATVLDGAVVGQGSVVAAGAVVTPGTVIPARSLVVGAPAKIKRELAPAIEEQTRALAHKYVRLFHNYRRG